MLEDDGSGRAVDQGSEQRRFPRVADQHRLFMIQGTERFQAETVDLSKSGMLAACPMIPPSLDKGSEVLFELVWDPRPEANAFIKGVVVRVIRDSDFDNVLLGVEFSEALAQSPAALRGFLDKVLGIEHGAVRVVKDAEGNKSLVFDFQPVLQEGTERLRVLQSSLFQSVDDLEEADRLLEGFGTGQHLFSYLADEAEAAPTVVGKTAAPGPAEPKETKKAKAKARKEKKLTEKKLKEEKLKEEKPKKEKPKKEKGTRPSLLRALIPSFGKPEKGGSLISPELALPSVANIAGLDVTLIIDGKKRRARAVRLYCAGIKCEIEGGLPELYRSVTMSLPNLVGKGEVVLNGDITRVRPDATSDDKGIFEIRLSLRNETGMLNDYRALVEKLSIGEV